MRLRALRLHGFKSFADRTEIVFHDGLTAVVGPNGCGKSNISDAIRWVLGEQRPTAIRGAKMEEAIFQGTVNRRPVNRGSVALVVVNEDGALPVPFGEVEIARTVYRDGGSEYALNRTTCRLRDIQDLCRDTGLGANAYAVIENRMVDAILSDRAEERRGLFEEAAGIGKYKDRRRAASRRLERAELDLQRLEDVIGEVESKVRSLARQKGKAERHRALRKRRLDLEVALASRRIEGLRTRLDEVRTELEGGAKRDEALRARIQTAESRVEALRADRTRVERARSRAAGRVEELRGELVRWERELAVAEERSGYAQRRLRQIDEEREGARSRAREARAMEEELGRRREGLREELEGVREELGSHEGEAEEVRERLASARESLAGLESRERDVARRIAQLQGDAEAAAARAEELGHRAEQLQGELAEARGELEEEISQGDLFTDRVAALARAVQEAGKGSVPARRAVEDAQAALEEARRRELESQDRAGALSARLSALEVMERDQEGVGPAVRTLLSEAPDGVLGLLADFVTADPDLSGAVEACLGTLLQGVVVRDSGVAEEVSRWFHEGWGKGGGVILLPLDRAPEPRAEDGILEAVEAKDPGAPWVRALLGGVALEDAPRPAPSRSGTGDRVARDGRWAERAGVVRVGNPEGAGGLLERKERIRHLRTEADQARRDAEAASTAREGARAQLDARERGLEEARARVREAEDAYREVRAEQSARTDRRRRMARSVEQLERELEATRTARRRAVERVEGAGEEGEALAREESALGKERAEATRRSDAIQAEWEAVRAEGSRLTVERTRLEGEAARAEERLGELERSRTAAVEREEALDREETELRDELERGWVLREQGREETERLFGLRDDEEEALRTEDQALSDLQEALAEAEGAAREARAVERESSEARHRLELDAQDLEGRIGRIRERLEGEWGRSYSRLTEEADPVEEDEGELRSELQGVVEALDRIGPVNMLAVEEHEEESARLRFLREQRDDLVEARDDLREAIREINQTAIRLFSETFEAIRENFRDTFRRLFEGGDCDLWLEDPEDPLESAIEIQASPQGKRTRRIDLLSGGERALTALALLFGIYLVKPSPFCVLDEVDAPLDESNIGRFIRLLEEFKERTQFVVITHNPRTIEAADWIYGVTMEEPGVSSIVGVRLEEALETAEA